MRLASVITAKNQVQVMDLLMQYQRNPKQLRSELLAAAEAHGWLVVTLLQKLAAREQTAFWYVQLGSC